MAGANDSALAIAVSDAGGLGSLPAAMLTPEGLAASWRRSGPPTGRPINVNFFCHRPPDADPAGERRWKDRLCPTTGSWASTPRRRRTPNRAPFDEAMCEVVEEARPEVVSFHFGLPAPAVAGPGAVERGQGPGLRHHGGRGPLAGGPRLRRGRGPGGRGRRPPGHVPGHRRRQPGGDDGAGAPGRRRRAGAGARLGGHQRRRGHRGRARRWGPTASSWAPPSCCCPEATTSAVHRAALADAGDDATALTNVMTGRPARAVVNRLMAELGPLLRRPAAFPRRPPAGAAAGPSRGERRRRLLTAVGRPEPAPLAPAPPARCAHPPADGEKPTGSCAEAEPDERPRRPGGRGGRGVEEVDAAPEPGSRGPSHAERGQGRAPASARRATSSCV